MTGSQAAEARGQQEGRKGQNRVQEVKAVLNVIWLPPSAMAFGQADHYSSLYIYINRSCWDYMHDGVV